MDPRLADTSFAAPAGAPLASGSDWRPLLEESEHAADLDAVERMIVALAAHRDGGRAEHAWLLHLDPALDALVVRHHAAPASGPLAEVLSAARIGGAGDAEDRAGRALAAEALGDVARAAWEGAEPACGVSGGDGPWRDLESVEAVALRRTGSRHALLVMGFAARPDHACVAARMARAAEGALAAQTRAAQLARRARQVAALSDLARAGVSTLNLAEYLHLVARLAVQGGAAAGAAVWRARDAELRLEVSFGPNGVRERLGRALEPLARAVLEDGGRRFVERPHESFMISAGAAEAIGAVAMLPCTAYGRTLGVMAVYHLQDGHPAEARGFEFEDRTFLTGVADSVALACDQADRCDQTRRDERSHDELRAQVARFERLAELGELTRQATERSTAPLASLLGFARQAYEHTAADDPRRECLEAVVREGERLERILGEHRQHPSVQARPSLGLECLNSLVRDVLQDAGETLVKRRVRLSKKLAPEIPKLLLDGAGIRSAIAHVVRCALDGIGQGGRIRIETRRAHGYVVFELAHDGPHEPGQVLEQLFVPFSNGRTGSGIGLAVAQRIVRQHGGEIRVHAEGDWSTIVSLTIPVLDNQDRRRSAMDRRSGRNDRRSRFPS